eukprot:5459600-Prymnesium_polylepis.1
MSNQRHHRGGSSAWRLVIVGISRVQRAGHDGGEAGTGSCGGGRGGDIIGGDGDGAGGDGDRSSCAGSCCSASTGRRRAPCCDRADTTLPSSPSPASTILMAASLPQRTGCST